jgi:PAS domain S-box-containing protein
MSPRRLSAESGPWLRDRLGLLGFGLCVFGLAWLATHIGSGAGAGVAAVWPVDAVVLVALLRRPRQQWLGLLLVAILSETATSLIPLTDWRAQLGLALCDALESVVAAAALVWILGRDIDLSKRRHLVTFGAVALAASFVSGLPASMVFLLAHGAPVADTLPNWILGDGLGLVIVTPALLAIRSGELKALFSAQARLRTLSVLGCEMLIVVAVSLRDEPLLKALIFAALMLPAVELGMTGAALGVLAGGTAMVGFAAVSPTLAHATPAVVQHNAFVLQIFLAIAAAVALGVAATMADRRKAERALTESERRYRQLAENASDIVVRYSTDGTIDYISPSIRHLGYEPGEMIGRNMAEFTHPEDEGYSRERREAYYGGREMASDDSHKSRVLKANGGWVWLEGTGSPIRDDAGQVIAVGSVLRDITARVAAEEALAKSEEQYRRLADHSTDIVVQVNLAGAIVYASPSVREMDYEPAELIGRDLVGLIHPDDLAELHSRYRDILAGAPLDPLARNLTRVARGGGGWILLEGRPSVIRDPSGAPTGFISQLRDVTERHAMEIELERKRAEAEAAAVAKSEFMANMSHEIRTPLTGMLGFAGLLEGLEGLPPTARKYVDRITVSGQALLSVVNDILDFSKLEADRIELDPHPFEPRALVSETLDLMAAEANRKGLSLSKAFDGVLPAAVFADSSRVRQVLLNLLTNAVKFTEEGGVTVTARYVTEEARLQIAVRDSGVGIPADRLDRLFQRFSQVDGSTTRQYGGTGLGLAICKRLTELMGGRIEVESCKGQGSTFWFTVDAPAAEPALLVEPAADKPDADGAGARILVVDDVAMNRELVRTMLSPFGFDIVEATGGAEAVAAALGGRFDLILMDLQMPGMDGLAATRAIRQTSEPNRGTPIIALSANVLPEHHAACHEAGMDDHIAKPISPAELITKIARWTAAADQDAAAEAAVN